jgi:hypothetical protein
MVNVKAGKESVLDRRRLWGRFCSTFRAVAGGWQGAEPVALWDGDPKRGSLDHDSIYDELVPSR